MAAIELDIPAVMMPFAFVISQANKAAPAIRLIKCLALVGHVQIVMCPSPSTPIETSITLNLTVIISRSVSRSCSWSTPVGLGDAWN